MQPPARVRYSPVVDALCIFVFVLVGRGRHEIHEGVGWFLTVLWPLYVGWFAVALATRLYTRRSGIWLALVVTWLGGIAIAALLRGSVHRPSVRVDLHGDRDRVPRTHHLRLAPDRGPHRAVAGSSHERTGASRVSRLGVSEPWGRPHPPDVCSSG